MLLQKIAIYILCFYSVALYGQTAKADRYFQTGNYKEAIKLYEKKLKKDSAAIILQKLGDSYFKNRNYESAEKIYYKLFKTDSTNLDNIHKYATVLQSQTKYVLAIFQFEKLRSNLKYANRSAEQLKFCRKVLFSKTKDTSYVVSNATLLNTKENEFSPFLLKDELYYTSEGKASAMYEAPNDQMIYTLAKRKIISKKSHHFIFSNKKVVVTGINKTGSIGAATFSDSTKSLYFTFVPANTFSKDTGKLNRPNIYFTKLMNHKWSASEPFVWNNPAYSFQHPTISKDGNLLIFASDMPGGFGKSDLYYSIKENNQWSKPKNLGADINTTENEVFPYLYNLTTLYFSSDGQAGFGGLDIFSSKLVLNKWTFVKNLGLMANSNRDDFGICFLHNDSTGLFSSNRVGGMGGDDIYNIVSLKKEMNISLNVYLTQNINDPASGRKIYLLNSEGEKVDSTLTDQFGHFQFKTFDVDKSYMIEVVENDVTFKNKVRYFILDKSGQTQNITHVLNPTQKFVFKDLAVDPSSMPDLFDDTGISLAGNVLLGKAADKPLANRNIIIKNSFGDVVQQTKTSALGSFAFRHLPVNQSYLLYIDDENISIDTKITVTNKNGKEIKANRLHNKNNFKYQILDVDKTSLSDLQVDDSELSIDLSGYLLDQDKKELVNATILILENDISVQNILTDLNGKFRAENLQVEKTYLFSLDDPDNKFKHVTKIYLADASRRIYKEIERRKDGKFEFKLLEVDKQLLGEVMLEDPWLQVLKLNTTEKKSPLTISESFNYPSGGWKVDNVISKILDKVAFILKANPSLGIVLMSHTDSQGADDFNMKLSEKRAQAAYDYLVSKQIVRNRLSAIGYGESKLLNECQNNIPCDDLDHSVNRRTEFKIVNVQSK